MFTAKATTNKRFIGRGAVLALFCVATFLIFSNLGNQSLWQDEAETALVSKTILQTGLPKITDGKNFFSQELGNDFDSNGVIHWLAWLPFYLTAFSFKLLGATTLAARLPFALLGLGTIFLAYFFAKQLWQSRVAGFFSAGFLTFCVPFLILTRQCRYYSPSAFFMLLGIYAYWRLTQNKKGAVPLLILAGAGLFHSQYIFCAILSLSLLIHALIWEKALLKKVLLSLLGLWALNLPWGIYLVQINFESLYGVSPISLGRNLDALKRYSLFIPSHLLHPALLVFVSAVGVRHFFLNKDRSSIALLVVTLFCHLIVMSLFSQHVFFRILSPIIPILMLLASYGAWVLYQRTRWLGCAVLIGFLFSNPLMNYAYEITHDYTGPIEGISKYLNKHGDPEDIVVITDGDLSLKFYTPMRILGGYTGEPLEDAKQADWVIRRRCEEGDEEYNVVEYFDQHIRLNQYEKIVLDVPDTCFENRESPSEHRFKTSDIKERVILYKRKT